VITNARLADHPSREPIDIAIADGKIAALGHPGLEAAGEIIETGRADAGLRVGQRALAVLRNGGGYAGNSVGGHVWCDPNFRINRRIPKPATPSGL
jgi:hypothetical protein